VSHRVVRCVREKGRGRTHAAVDTPAYIASQFNIYLLRRMGGALMPQSGETAPLRKTIPPAKIQNPQHGSMLLLAPFLLRGSIDQGPCNKTGDR